MGMLEESRALGARQQGSQQRAGIPVSQLNAAWVEFMRYCAELGHGEIERLKIQDGLPMLAEQAIKKVKFSP